MVNAKKLFIIFGAIIALTAVLLVVVIVNGNNSIDKRVAKSLSETSEIDVKVSISDQDVLVYEQTKQYVFNDVTQVTTSTTSIDNSFKYSTVTETEKLDKVDKTKMFAINYNNEYYSKFEKTNDSLSAVVKNECIGQVFNGMNINSTSNVDLEINFVDGKLDNITCKYITDSNKEVVITYHCIY